MFITLYKILVLHIKHMENLAYICICSFLDKTTQCVYNTHNYISNSLSSGIVTVRGTLNVPIPALVAAATLTV